MGQNILIEQVKAIISNARSLTIKSVNTLHVVSNFLIGFRIVEFEQEGKEKAGYGKKLLKDLSKELTLEFGKGYSVSNLENIRRFYLAYSDRIIEKSQTVSGKLISNIKDPKSETLSGIFKDNNDSEFLEILKDISLSFSLSWSHYVFLINIKDLKERSFYEIEALNQDWSLRELKRQYNSSLYERLALSRDKEEVKKLSSHGQIVEKPSDMIKNPYILEFLGLDEKSKYSETTLETAIIDKLEHFLLELGKGFLFEARQKRFSFDEDHYYVDLVFYNRLLRCYTLIDLKIGELSHQDLGQMQMYVNYYDRFVKLHDEKPTIGIILCKKNKESLVEITLPKDSNIHASEYKLYLPSKDELRRQLDEAEKEWEEKNEKY